MKSVLKSLLLSAALVLSASCRSSESTTNQRTEAVSSPPAQTPTPTRPPEASGSPSAPAGSQINSAEAKALQPELVNVKRAVLRSALNGDARTAADYLADDFKNIKPDGTVENKSQYLASLKPLEGLDTFLVPEVKIVSLEGDRAVMTGLVQAKIYEDGYRETFRDTFVNKGGRWLLLESESTGLKKD